MNFWVSGTYGKQTNHRLTSKGSQSINGEIIARARNHTKTCLSINEWYLGLSASLTPASTPYEYRKFFPILYESQLINQKVIPSATHISQKSKVINEDCLLADLVTKIGSWCRLENFISFVSLNKPVNVYKPFFLGKAKSKENCFSYFLFHFNTHTSYVNMHEHLACLTLIFKGQSITWLTKKYLQSFWEQDISSGSSSGLFHYWDKKDIKSFFLIFGGIFYFLFVLYSALLHLPPLRFHCADGCWDRTRTVATGALAVRRSNH
jgi:hypothetical protein